MIKQVSWKAWNLFKFLYLKKSSTEYNFIKKCFTKSKSTFCSLGCIFYWYELIISTKAKIIVRVLPMKETFKYKGEWISFFNSEEDIRKQRKSTIRKILQLNLISILLNSKHHFNITNRQGFVSIFVYTNYVTRYTPQDILKLI